MVFDVLRTLADGRAAEVRIPVSVDLLRRHWPVAEPGTVEVAAGGEVIWEIMGLEEGDRAEIRVLGAEPLVAGDPPPTIFDPFETLERTDATIRASIFHRARGRYRYVIELERADGSRVSIRCEPAEMGGVDVSGPPTGT